MEEIQTLNQIAYKYFNGDSFNNISFIAKQIVVDIQRNQILQSTLRLEKSRIRDTTYIDD